MSLTELLTAPWAVLPETLLEMQEVYRVHLRGDKIDVHAIEARLGRPLQADQQTYEVQHGAVGVLMLEGVIAPKANLFTQICGGISATQTIQQLESMAADSRVRSVALAIDSPGGAVQLVPAVAAAVRNLAKAKPTVAVSTGTMASALYWIGSAANAIYISGSTDLVGSIGVVATHNYQPRAAGQVTTEITAGSYKRMGSPNAPLNDAGRAYLQSQVDEIYRAFLGDVAAHRGTTPDQVHTEMADGRVWVGQQAIDRGLADGVATLSEVVDQLATDPTPFAARRKAVFAMPAPRQRPPAGVAAQGIDATAALPASTDEPGSLTVQAEPHHTSSNTPPQEDQSPMNAADIAAQFAAEHPEAAALLRAEGSTAETERRAGVLAQAVPGHDALIQQLANDGRTTPEQAAMQVLAAVRTSHATAAAAHFADAPAAAPTANTAGNSTELTRQEQADQAKAYAAEHGCDFLTALRKLGFA